MPRQHVLEVWDPTSGPEMMQAHLRVLLSAVKASRAKASRQDDVHVWWGHRNDPRSGPAAERFGRVSAIEVETERDDPGPETHLYLTDFSSLYVAHLGGVTREDVRQLRDGRVPHVYKQRHQMCDIWYRLWDLRRLVEHDTATVARELRKLRVIEDGRAVELHQGLPAAPMLVHDSGEVRYFDPPTRKHFIEDKFWVEFDAGRSGVGLVEQDLRENRFGGEAWGRLGPLARSFIGTAEKIWRDHAIDPLFDVSVVLLELSKAVEVRGNAILREVLARAPELLRFHNLKGRSVDITTQLLTLNELAAVIGGPDPMRKFLRTHLRDGAWFVEQLPAVLHDLVEHRNRSAHGETVEWHDVARWRAALLGVGSYGHLVQLAGVANL